MLIGFGFSPSKPKKSGGVSYDADASTFFTAASITDNTQKSAVNQLVLDLKSYGVWTKCRAIYPIVGGSAGSHAVNLKTPGTFNFTFSTGWTHSSTGMTPTNAYANTNLNQTAQGFGQNEGSFGLYSRTARGGNDGWQHGNLDTGKYALMIPWGTSSQIVNFHNSVTSTAISTTASTGFFQMSRTTSTNTFHARNSTVTTVSLTSTGVPNGNFYFGARNNIPGATADAFDSIQLAFCYIAKDGLSSAELGNFYTAVQAYQTTLSRQV